VQPPSTARQLREKARSSAPIPSKPTQNPRPKHHKKSVTSPRRIRVIRALRLLDRARGRREYCVGVGAYQSDSADDKHKNDRQHHGIFRDVLPAKTVHGHQDTPELREQIRSMLQDEDAATAEAA